MAKFSALGGYRPPSLVLSRLSYESLGNSMRLLTVSADASVAWPVAALGIIIPFTLVAPATYVLGLFYNGATALGTVDVGIYNEAYGLVVSTGAITQAGTNVVQELAMADTKLMPGRYYIAASCSLGTTTVFSSVTVAGRGAAAGMAQMATAHPLPATFVPALYAQTLVPNFGVTQRTLV